MPPKHKPTGHEKELQQRIGELQARLDEAEETLRAIREGEVDAVVVSGTRGEQIFSLVGTDSIYRLIVESMNEAALTMTLEGSILFCNGQFGQLVKLPIEQVVGRPLRDFIAPDSLEDISSFIASAQREPLRQRIVFLTSDRTRVPALISGNVLDQQGSLSLCLVARDLSELENSTELIQKLRHQQLALEDVNKQLASSEDRFRNLAASLETQVVERTATLSTAIGDIESFTYTVAHDLRAPLRHMAGFASLLRHHMGQTLDSESRGYLKDIDNSVKKMALLIDDLLAFAQVGQAQIRKSRIHTRALVEEIVLSFKPDLGDRRIIWKVDQMPDIYGDLGLIRQVLTNIIDNALKFTSPREKAQIKIGGSSANEEDIIFIGDNGVGLDMAHSGKVFQVFQRLHDSKQFKGTGIGLAIVQRVIERHGGRTWIESIEGSGTTVYFSLPRH